MDTKKYKKLIIYILCWGLIYTIGSTIIIIKDLNDVDISNDMFGEHLKYYEKIVEVENVSVD